MPDESDKLAAATLAASLLQIEAQAANFQTPINPQVAAKRYLACLEAIQDQKHRPVYLVGGPSILDEAS